MNVKTIQSQEFKNAFELWWNLWKTEKRNFGSLQEWWDVTKTKIKQLTMEISKNLSKNSSKKYIENLEKQLNFLKTKTGLTDSDKNKLDEIELLIYSITNRP